MNTVIPIRYEAEYLANCPDCRGTFWILKLDGVGEDWGHIIGVECVECGLVVDWQEGSDEKGQ